MTKPNVIEMHDITKKFGEFVANDHINLDVRQGEIHALLGENGAGKSTLMNMLSGLLQPTSGTIKVKEQEVTIDSPSKATKLGIGMVHQHFMLVEAFTVAENIILGSEVTKAGGVLDMKKAIKEITELLNIMKTLVKEGKSIILITHKLDEIRAVSDRVTVIRRGKSIDTVTIEGSTNADLAEMMVGHQVSFKTEKIPSNPKEVVLSIKDLVVNENRGIPAVKNLSLDVRAGEIIGIAGIDGNGQTELVQAITGLRKVKSGDITIKGESIIHKTTRQITEMSVGHIPEDRHRDGMVLEMTVAENIALQTYYKEPNSKNGILNYNVINAKARELMEEFDVRGAGELIAGGELSGGNQQKAVIAREIDRDPELLIVSQPTRGLDVGAIEYIRKRIIAERDKGKAVIVVSFELDEILDMSDRIAVIYDGAIQGILDPAETNKQDLGILMAGGQLNKEEANV